MTRESLAWAIRCAAVAAAAFVAGCTTAPAANAPPDMRILGNFTLECDKQGNNECWVPLVVSVEGPDCVIGYVFRFIETPKNIKVIWYLNKADGYAFDGTKGIDIKNNNGAFDSNGHHNGQAHQFTWKAKPVNPAQSRDYDIVVRHVASGKKCDFRDPTIVNRGV